METKLTGIAEKAKNNPELKFTTLVHLINEETLIKAHKSMPKKESFRNRWSKQGGKQ